MEQLKWETKKVKVKDLIRLDINPRKISEDKKQKLVQSLEKFNLVEIPAVNTDLQIIGGNQRVTALLLVGRGEEEIDVRFPNRKLTKKEVKEYAIISNTHAGEFDFEILDLEFADISIGELGFEIEGWDDWKNKQDTLLAGEAQEDDFDVPVGGSETDIVLGDLFEIGEHRLLCGDSTDSEQVAKLMNGEKADSCITSPPYNQGGGSGDLFSHGKRVESLYENNFDNKSKEEYFDFCISILNNISLILKNEHSVIWNVSYNAKSRDDYGKIIFSELNPFTVKETILWNKGGSINLPQPGIYSRKVEFVFIMSKYDKYLTSQIYGDCRWNLWETTKVNQLSNHKATFSIEFAEKAINELTLLNNLIYEPFCGSGTTMVASHQLKRKCYGMELDPKYCEVIVTRMIKLDNTLTIKRNGVDETQKWLEKMV